MVKASPPIESILNNTLDEETDLSDLDKIPGFDSKKFIANIMQFFSSTDNPQYTVFAPDNHALRRFARQTINDLVDLEDERLKIWRDENNLSGYMNSTMVNKFILSPQGRLCRYNILVNHIKLEDTSFEELKCGEAYTMLSTEVTNTTCDDIYQRRNLQNDTQQEVQGFKYQLGTGNQKKYTTQQLANAPKIVDPNHLVSNGFVHVVTNVVLPTVDPDVIYETVRETVIIYTTEYVTQFEECNCPVCVEGPTGPTER